MKLDDLIHLKGDVLIRAIDSEGSMSTLVDDRNLIVSSGRDNICTCLLGTSGAYINGIAFGTGGTASGNQSIALTVEASDTTVNTPVDNLSTPTDYTFTPAQDSVPSPRLVFDVVVPKLGTALNTKAISELALMMSTGEAFAIKRFPSITKSADVSLLITWTIYV